MPKIRFFVYQQPNRDFIAANHEYQQEPFRYLHEIWASLHSDLVIVNARQKAIEKAIADGKPIQEAEKIGKKVYLSQFYRDLHGSPVEINGIDFNHGVPTGEEDKALMAELRKRFKVRQEIACLHQGLSAQMMNFFQDNFGVKLSRKNTQTGSFFTVDQDNTVKLGMRRRGSCYHYHVELTPYWFMHEGQFYMLRQGKLITVDSPIVAPGGAGAQWYQQMGYEPFARTRATFELDLSSTPPEAVRPKVSIEVLPHSKVNYKGPSNDNFVRIHQEKGDSTRVLARTPQQYYQSAEYRKRLETIEQELKRNPALRVERFAYEDKKGVVVEVLKRSGESEFVEHTMKRSREVESRLSSSPSYEAIAVLFKVNAQCFPLHVGECGRVDELMKVYKAAKFCDVNVRFSPADEQRLSEHSEYKAIKDLSLDQFEAHLAQRQELKTFQACFRSGAVRFQASIPKPVTTSTPHFRARP